MALIGTIRKNFWFVLILLGLALAAFILMDIMGNQNRTASSPEAGNIDGTTVKYQDFQKTQSILYSNASADQGAITNAVWNYYVEKSLIDSEASNLGLNISKDELMELQFGNNPSQIIKQNFSDPQTGQIRRADLLSFKTAIEEGTFDNDRLRQFWSEQEKQIKKTALQDKLNNMVSKAIYTPTWQVEESYRDNNLDIDVSYVNVPFASIEDSEVEVSDAAITKYLNDNKVKYTVAHETRKADFIVFDVIATPEDSTSLRTEASRILTGLKSSQNDSLYAVTNSGSFVNYYYGLDELPETVKANIVNMSVGDVYGPYIENAAYSSFKLTETKIVPDSVKASHILRSVDPNIPGQLAQAKATIDSLRTEIEAGRLSFADAATANSQDPGSGAKGGDLGYFVQSTMVPGFKDACFYYGKKGGLYTVNTQFGVHLIKIVDQKFLNNDPKYKMAFVRTPIKPSEETQKAVDSRVSDLVSEFSTLAALKTAIAEDKDLNIETSGSFKSDDFTFGALGGGNTSRDIIKWMFDEDTDLGDVSPEIYAYQDKALYYYNKYVAVALSEITPAGLPSAASARNTVEAIVRNQLKGDLLKSKISGTDLNAIASQFNTSVDTLKNLSFGASVGTKLSNESKVIAAAFSQDENATSSPVVGESGVYLVKTLTKYAAPEPSNIPQLRKTQSQSFKSQVNFRLIEALKKTADIKDSRSALGI